MKKESWTEDEVLAIALESDSFERKSGELWRDGNFDKDVAKAICAFANSTGGHVLLGARNDGSFDGVEPIRKKTTTTIEWLGQKISDLLDPAIQDFRIHEVTRSESSQIPENKILVVVDVGRSDLAPHQSRIDHHYYYRVDRESKPAPHRYLELLFNREKFPGPRVANAWLQTVINPLMYAIKQEKIELENQRWGLDIHRPSSLPAITILLDSFNSGNTEQFFLNYPDILDFVKTHDEKARHLVEVVNQCHELMSQSFHAAGLYDGATSLESLLALHAERASDSHKFQTCKERIDYVKVLFSKDDPVENSRYLVQCMINGSLTGHDYTFAPLWVAHRQRFLGERDSRYANEMSRIRNAGAAVLTETKSLIVRLETERIDLCFRHGLPFEEQPLTIYQANPHPRFW